MASPYLQRQKLPFQVDGFFIDYQALQCYHLSGRGSPSIWESRPASPLSKERDFSFNLKNSQFVFKISDLFKNAMTFAIFANFKRFKQFLKGFQAVLNMFLNSIFAIFSAYPVLFMSIYLDSTLHQVNVIKRLNIGLCNFFAIF